MRLFAELDPFPTVLEATVHHPAVGSALSLHCSVPECYPPGRVYWGESRNGLSLRPIETSERLALDYDGDRPYIMTYLLVTLTISDYFGQYFIFVSTPCLKKRASLL